MAKSYEAKDLTVLKGLEAVRMRPGMYIGTTESRGLHHLLWEIVDNAIDEAANGFADTVSVTLHKDNSVTVEAVSYTHLGAGYIALEEEKYQVVLAVYASKEDAQTVKDRLLEQNEMETMIKQKSVGNTTLNMKASLTQKEALEKVLSDLDAVRKDLDAANASIDQLQTAKEHANEAKTTLKNMQTRLAGAFNKGENSFADGLSDLVNNMLLDITAAEEKTDGYVAAGIRHAHVRSYYGYIALLTSMTEK